MSLRKILSILLFLALAGCTPTGDGLKGQYYSGLTFYPLVAARIDARINFNWAQSPDPIVSMVSSQAWTGKIHPRYSGTYSFYVTVKGPVKLWVNDILIINKWTNQTQVVTYSGTAGLTANQQVNIKMQTASFGYGLAKLEWQSAAQTREVVPQSQLYSTVQPPASPVLNAPVAGQGQVSLSWNAVSGAASYRVYYGTSQQLNISKDVGNVTSYMVTGLTGGTTYYCRVSTWDGLKESVLSNIVSAVPTVVPVPPQPGGYVSSTEYNESGQVTKIIYGNGTIETYTYNQLNFRLTRKLTKNSSNQTLQDLNYTYDKAGNILTITDALRAASQTFTYDEQSRLVSANGTRYGAKNYQYDQVGNIVQKDGGIYSYGASGAGIHAVTHIAGGTNSGMDFTYDMNGNMSSKFTSGGTWEYGYDTENRLKTVKKNGASVSVFSYDGDGGRVKKIANGVITRFVGSLFETSASRNTLHVYLGATRIASITGDAMYFTHTDHLGGSNIVTDAGGVLKELTEYEPFGQYAKHEKYGTDEEVARFYFTGQRLDDETGLYFYNARYYDPSLGRFITPDSIVQDPMGNPQTLNRYSYAGNNPVNIIDPTGHFFWAAIVAIVKAVSAAATAVASYVAANATAIAVGAAVGGAVGGVSSVAMGGNFWQGVGMGAIGGGVFAGLTPAFSGMMKMAFTGTTKVSLIGGARFTSNVIVGALGGASSGAAVAAYAGADVGEAAWQGAAIGGTLSAVTEANRYMRTKMIQQSRKNPLNIGADSGGGPFQDKTKIAGTRALKGATKLENCGPLGGCQGGKGEFFGISYEPNSALDYVHESFAGPHDYLGSFLYDAQGNGKVFNNVFMQGGSFSYSVGALPVAAPFAVAPIITQNGLTPAASIYGIFSWSDEHQYNSRGDDN